MPRRCPPRLLILDCDGVLIRSERANLAYYNHLFEAFELPLVADDDGDRLRLLHTLSTPQVVEAFVPEGLRSRVLSFAGGVSYSLFLPYLEAEPGWGSVLRRVRRRMPVAVATNRGASARDVLQAIDLLGTLDLVVTIRDVARPKPHPDLLWRTLDHFQVPNEEALYVGDSELDRQAAQAAGVSFLGFRTPQPPSVRSPEEVEAHLARLAAESGSASMARLGAPRT